MKSQPPIYPSPRKDGEAKSFSDHEVPIMEAGYRLLAEPEAFDELLAAWNDRIEAYEARRVNSFESEQLARTSAIISSLFERLPEDTPEQGIEQYTRNLAAPALVMTLGNQVLATNEAAASRFGVAVGRRTGLEWLEPQALTELDRLRRSARTKGNQMQAVLQLPRQQRHLRVGRSAHHHSVPRNRADDPYPRAGQSVECAGQPDAARGFWADRCRG
jgi:hypothetical protein